MASKSQVIENTREQILSSDLNRMQQLGIREWLNQFQDMGRDDSDRSYTTGDDKLTQQHPGSSVDYFQKLPNITKSGASMAITLTAGEALQEFGVPPNPDDPNYIVHRWLDTVLTPAVGNGANPRIDLIVSTQATVPTDAQTRNVLQNPSTGVVAPETVFKTSNPQSTLSIVAGTPAASPVPPVAPLGSLILYEILVPTLSTLATQTSLARQLQRFNVYVGTSYHGVLKGCTPIFGSVVSGGPLETASADILLPDNQINRVVIDGEVLVFAGGVTTGLLPKFVFDAGANNPFGVAAPTADRSYFLYVCGGKWLRNRSKDNGGGNNGLDPVVIVESLVPPTTDGRPSAAITTPSGTTVQGAVYIGLGYTVYNTTFRKRVFWEDDYCWARAGLDNVAQTHPAGSLGFNEGAAAGFSQNIVPAAATVITLGSQPNGGAFQAYRRAKLKWSLGMSQAIPGAGTTLSMTLCLGPFANQDIIRSPFAVHTGTAGWSYFDEDQFDVADIPIAGSRLTYKLTNPLVAGDNASVTLHALAWKMNVNRLGSI